MNKEFKILIIEDSHSDYVIIQRLLRGSASTYHLKQCSSISDAQDALNQNNHFDIILLDLSLPDSLGGLQTFDQVYSMASGIPIIVLSGLDDDDISLQAVKRGAQDYLNKNELTAELLRRSISYSIERKTVVDELLQTKKMASIGTLAGGIAHDFNNLLTIILGYADMSLSHCGKNKKLRKHLREIKTASNTAKELTQQLLTFSRNKPQKRSITNLNTIIDVMRKSLLRLISENVNIRLDLAQDLWNTKVDSSQIERIILNLCLNAQDALTPKGGMIEISTSNEILEDILEHGITRIPPGSYCRLRVSDNGIGIPKDLIENIFEPFFTTKRLGESHHGAGMGLSIVYGAVVQARGYIVVDSAVSQGTTFDIYLPKCLEVQSSGQIVGSTASHEKKSEATILVVEDEDGVRELVNHVLLDEGYNILVADSPNKALEINKNAGHIDLILTDILMPEMNGQDLTKLILKDRPNTKIMYMSGYAEDALSVQGFDNAGASFFMKPFTPKQLVDKVAEVLAMPCIQPDPGQTELSFTEATQLSRKNTQQIKAPLHAGKLRLLNVDDHTANAGILTKILAPYAESDYAENGQDAITLFKKAHTNNTPYDVILLDLMMPKMNGIETLQKIRSLEKEMPADSPKTKIILLTAIEESIDNLSLDPDMFYDGYLQKPASGPAILKELKRLGFSVENLNP